MRKKQIDQQRLAEFGQLFTQLLKPGQLIMKPRISIGQHFSEDELRQVMGQGALLYGVRQRAKALFKESGAYFGDFIA